MHGCILCLHPRSVVGLASAVEQTRQRKEREGTETGTLLAVSHRWELGGICSMY
jgi:hypothetical protein